MEKTIGENPIENYKQKSYRIFYRKFKVFLAKGTLKLRDSNTFKYKCI